MWLTFANYTILVNKRPTQQRRPSHCPALSVPAMVRVPTALPMLAVWLLLWLSTFKAWALDEPEGPCAIDPYEVECIDRDLIRPCALDERLPECTVVPAPTPCSDGIDKSDGSDGSDRYQMTSCQLQQDPCFEDSSIPECAPVADPCDQPHASCDGQ